MERLTWGPGKWIRTSFGYYVWKKQIVHAHAPAEAGPVLARVWKLRRDVWHVWVYPYGEMFTGSKDVVYPRTTGTLREAQAVAMREFVARRAVIEGR